MHPTHKYKLYLICGFSHQLNISNKGEGRHSCAKDWGRENGFSSKLFWLHSRPNALNLALDAWKITF
jgi:hypothetical protein